MPLCYKLSSMQEVATTPTTLWLQSLVALNHQYLFNLIKSFIKAFIAKHAGMSNCAQHLCWMKVSLPQGVCPPSSSSETAESALLYSQPGVRDPRFPPPKAEGRHQKVQVRIQGGSCISCLYPRPHLPHPAVFHPGPFSFHPLPDVHFHYWCFSPTHPRHFDKRNPGMSVQAEFLSWWQVPRCQI